MNFEAVSKLRVLVIGDAIIDRYVFVRPLGKSMKESVLSVGYEREEEYRGGVWAAAAQLADLCAEVDVMHGPQVMANTRFVEGDGNRKLLTLHELKEELPSRRDPQDYDAVIVTDFGHGTMDREQIELVSREARFLAVNAQTNSQNFGFNLITKYPRADLVVIDEIEARLAARDRDSPIEDVIRSLGFARVIVTRGSHGAVGFDDGRFHRVPAIADKVVDTIGAGDAFLVVAAVFACAGRPMAEIVAAGNAAGAAKVGVVGHRRAITRGDLQWS